MPHITITFLGTTAGIPTRERAHTAIHVAVRDQEERCFLFDCGEGTQRQLLFAYLNPMKVNEIFMSHWHGDHCYGLPGLINTMDFEKRKKPLIIYGPPSGVQSQLIDLIGQPKNYEVEFKPVTPQENDVMTVFDSNVYSVVATPVHHTVSSVAYAVIIKDKITIDKEKAIKAGLPEQGKIYQELKKKKEIEHNGKKISLESIAKKQAGKKIVYSGDTEVCTSLTKLSDNADILIHECTYFDAELAKKEAYKHSSLDDILKMLRQIRVKKVVLTHISRRHQNKDDLAEFIKKYPNIVIAQDFLKLEV